MAGFKFPQDIPQDLLLIQELVGGAASAHTTSLQIERDEDIDSSASEIDSQDEIEAQLLSKMGEDGPTTPGS